MSPPSPLSRVTAFSWWWALHNSVKLWALSSRAIQDRSKWRVLTNVLHQRRKWQPTTVFLPQEPHEQYEKTKRYNTGDEHLRSESVYCATGEEQRTITIIAPKRMKRPKWKWHSVVDVSGGEKACLKFNIQKTKSMTSDLITHGK